MGKRWKNRGGLGPQKSSPAQQQKRGYYRSYQRLRQKKCKRDKKSKMTQKLKIPLPKWKRTNKRVRHVDMARSKGVTRKKQKKRRGRSTLQERTGNVSRNKTQGIQV